MTRLLTQWAEVVGEDIARCTRPVRISHGKGFGGTLTVLTTGPQAPLVQMQLPMIRDKVNACYGFNAVARVTITQTAPQGFAEGQAEFRPAPRVARAPAPETVAAAELRQFIERVERLEEEKAAIQGDIKDVMGEAKGRGYDTKAIRTIIRLRKKDANERIEEETILQTYMAALGME